MAELDNLKRHLERGSVYRRSDLLKWSRSVDRHLATLVGEGYLKKVAPGVYSFPKETSFGEAPPEDEALVRSFLKDDRFLLTSLNAYNSLGVGTTQLYNQKIVYNHKRHGEFKLGNRTFYFKIKHHFPRQLDQEFLLVDLVNNLDELAEDRDLLVKNISVKAHQMDAQKLLHAVAEYGNSKTQRLFSNWLPH